MPVVTFSLLSSNKLLRDPAAALCDFKPVHPSPFRPHVEDDHCQHPRVHSLRWVFSVHPVREP